MRLSVVSLTVLAFCGAAHAQIDGGRSYERQIPSFRELPPWDPAYRAPRTPDGKPDLQGVWSSASLTLMTRGVGARGGIAIDTLVIPDDQLNKHVADSYYTKEYKAQAFTDPKTGPGDGEGDGKGGADIRGYNFFWTDPGAEYARVNGEWRSSWIVSPANGQMPFSPEGRKARQTRMTAARSSPNTGPEVRTLGDRCLISYTGQAGPPLVNGMYNNHYQIVQTPTQVMINTEMNHDVRVIGVGAKPRPDAVRPWFGDSVAHWDGETLVVETRNLHPVQSAGGFVPLSPKGRITERFTRKSEFEILYAFEVDDPVYYTEVWKGEMPLRRSKEKLYEYACHEGNYALSGMLRGDAMGKDTALDKDGE